eukprot:1142302-Pelagomonas_calceolata.AAC.4
MNVHILIRKTWSFWRKGLPIPGRPAVQMKRALKCKQASFKSGKTSLKEVSACQIKLKASTPNLSYTHMQAHLVAIRVCTVLCKPVDMSVVHDGWACHARGLAPRPHRVAGVGLPLAFEAGGGPGGSQ